MTDLCDAEASGFTCDRDKNHGSIHHHPDHDRILDHDHYWVSFPHGLDEMNGFKPWSGYLLVHDSALPMSSSEQKFDARLIELFIESFKRKAH